ncbi:MAG: hypothetical protein JW894_01980 [Bacteroidales bacterium]|nr:hypothetical protein [Bacteroidales bacterium]
MKKFNRILLSVFLFSLAFSCSEDYLEDMPDATADEKCHGYDNYDEPNDFCNDEPVIFDLIAGRHDYYGYVSIVNDEENLYITFNTTRRRTYLKEIHVYAGDIEGVPVSRGSGPVPGRFPYKKERIYDRSYTLTIPLSEIDTECPLILAHAEFTNRETGWAWEDHNQEFTFYNFFNVRRWGYLGDYCIARCEEPKLFTLKSMFNLADSSFAALMFVEDEYYETTKWCSQMGVVNLTGNGAVDIYQYDGGKIGVLDIVIENGMIKGTITVDSPEVLIFKTNVFYGTEEELATYGVCPKQDQFPYNFTDGEASSFEIPIE